MSRKSRSRSCRRSEPRQPLLFEQSLPLMSRGARQGRAGRRTPGHPPRRLAAGRRAARVGHDAAYSDLLPRAGSRGARPARRQAPPRRGRQVHQRRRARGRSNQGDRRGGFEPARLPVAARHHCSASTRGHGRAASTCSSSWRCRFGRTAAADRCWSCREQSDEWLESIVRPISYAVQPAFTRARRCSSGARPSEQDLSAWKDAFRDAIEAIAGLTAVDGATIINDRYDLMAFGAKILRRRGSPVVEQVVVTEPIVGGSARGRPSDAARRHAPPVGRAVRARPARRAGARRIPGRTLHRVRLVAVRGNRPCASDRSATL